MYLWIRVWIILVSACLMDPIGRGGGGGGVEADGGQMQKAFVHKLLIWQKIRRLFIFAEIYSPLIIGGPACGRRLGAEGNERLHNERLKVLTITN